MTASIKEMIEFEKGSPSDDNYQKIFEETKMVGRELVDDMVNHPPHYNQKGIECIDAIEAATADGSEYYLQGNIIKYIWRYRYKNGIQDLEKAKWYLNRLIAKETENGKRS